MRNCIERCEFSSTMAVQAKAWMMGLLFSKRINHFIISMEIMEKDITTESKSIDIRWT